MAGEALQVKKRHATESGMLVLATLFFIISSFLVVSELKAYYVHSPEDWDLTRDKIMREAKSHITTTLDKRKDAGLKPFEWE